MLVGYTLTAPWWAPHVMVGDDLARDGYFLGAPYCNGYGYMSLEPEVDPCAKSWSGHFQAEYGNDFEDLSRISGRVLLEHRTRFGIDTQWNYFSEDRGSFGNDHLWVGDANIVFRFAQTERLAMRSGLGVNWLADDIGGEAGFNFTYGIDYFPCRPLVLSAEMDLGRVGDATLFHGRAAAGVIFGHTEAFVGYDYYDIGDAQIHGPFAGIGIWF